MIGFLKKLFGGDKPDESRVFSHPRDLRQGDFLTFGYLPQADLSGKTFEVYKVNTYNYGGLYYPEMILKDSAGTIVFMAIEEEDGEEYVCVSKKVPKSDIRDIIPQDVLDSITAKGTGITLKVNHKPEGFEKWLMTNYVETDESRGSFVKSDLRREVNNQAEQLMAYTLMDNSDEFALEIEVYGESEVELSATVYHDIDCIEEILPRSLKS